MKDKPNISFNALLFSLIISWAAVIVCVIGKNLHGTIGFSSMFIGNCIVLSAMLKKGDKE